MPEAGTWVRSSAIVGTPRVDVVGVRVAVAAEDGDGMLIGFN